VDVRGTKSTSRPVLYTILTSDPSPPRSRNVLKVTYADDTAFLARSALPRVATDMVQEMLNEFKDWESRWNIANAAISQRATFLLNRLNTNRLTLDGTPTKHSSTVKYR